MDDYKFFGLVTCKLQVFFCHYKLQVFFCNRTSMVPSMVGHLGFGFPCVFLGLGFLGSQAQFLDSIEFDHPTRMAHNV